MTKDSNTTDKPAIQVKPSEADKIWSEISGLPIEMYAIPNQKVEDHLERVPVPGESVLAKPKSTAVIAALDSAIGKAYVVTTTERGHILISRATPELDIKEEYVSFPRANGKVDKILRKKLYNS